MPMSLSKIAKNFPGADLADLRDAMTLGKKEEVDEGNIAFNLFNYNKVSINVLLPKYQGALEALEKRGKADLVVRLVHKCKNAFDKYKAQMSEEVIKGFEAFYAARKDLVEVRKAKKGGQTEITEKLFAVTEKDEKYAKPQQELLDALLKGKPSKVLNSDNGKGYATTKDFLKNLLKIEDKNKRSQLVGTYAVRLNELAQEKNLNSNESAFVGKLIKKLKKLKLEDAQKLNPGTVDLLTSLQAQSMQQPASSSSNAQVQKKDNSGSEKKEKKSV
jgi:hypothetical protein